MLFAKTALDGGLPKQFKNKLFLSSYLHYRIDRDYLLCLFSHSLSTL